VHGTLSIVVIGFVQDAFGDVVFGAVLFSLLMSLLILFTRHSDSAYDQIGRGGISRDSEYGAGAAGPTADSPAGQAEREREIRQMLDARSERLVRRGEPALDVEAELARLLADEPAHASADAGLLAEVRQLVVARNERRVRQGLEPLDVDSEVARTLNELGS
jgi:hypothetical protein